MNVIYGNRKKAVALTQQRSQRFAYKQLNAQMSTDPEAASHTRAPH